LTRRAARCGATWNATDASSSHTRSVASIPRLGDEVTATLISVGTCVTTSSAMLSTGKTSYRGRVSSLTSASRPALVQLAPLCARLVPGPRGREVRPRNLLLRVDERPPDHDCRR